MFRIEPDGSLLSMILARCCWWSSLTVIGIRTCFSGIFIDRNDFGLWWFCLSFLARIFRVEWLTMRFSIFCRGKFWTILFIIEFILWIPIGRRKAYVTCSTNDCLQVKWTRIYHSFQRWFLNIFTGHRSWPISNIFDC